MFYASGPQTCLCYKTLSYRVTSDNGFLKQLVFMGWGMCGWHKNIWKFLALT